MLCLHVFLHVGGASLPFEGLDDLRGPYEGTGAFGEALYVLPLGKAGNWPIRAVWSSAHSASSPYLGFGWRIPALESRFVRLDERRSAFYQPDGYVRIFVPVKDGDRNVLTGGAAWEAVVDGHAVRVTADPRDGAPKSKFFFSNGRLVRMECEEGKFEIKYEGRMASEIVSGGRTLLKIVRHSSPEKSTEFRFAGAASRVIAVCSPAIVFKASEDSQSAPEQLYEDCLASLRRADGTEVNFSYGEEAGKAFLSVDGLRWTWDPYTRKILGCGDWSYTIGETYGKEEAPTFRRSNADGRHESYSCSRKTGLVKQKFANGAYIEYRMFTSGPLAYRRVRRMRKIEADGSSVYAEYKYNKDKRLCYRKAVYEGGNPVVDEVWLDDSGRIVRRRVDGKEVPLK